MKKLIALAVLALSSVAAQQTTAQDPNEDVRKVISLKYADPAAIQALLRDFGVASRADTRLKVIALTGRRANVTTAEEAIKQLDVPAAEQKDIELTAYFVVGTDQANAAGNAIPADLQSTIAALKSTFPFKNYGLLDVLFLRTRSGSGADASGQFGTRITTFRIGSASIERDGLIRLERLHAGLRNPVADGPNKITYVDTGISADVMDVREGQKLVVGRSSLDGPEKALFLVLVAKVAQ